MLDTYTSEKITKSNFGQIVDYVPGVVTVFSIESGEYLYVNKSLKKILGYTADEFMKGGIKFAAAFVHPDDMDELQNKNSKAIMAANKRPRSKDDEPLVTFEYRIRHKKGHWVWLQTDGMVYKRNELGNVSQIVNISIDITERKLAESKLNDLSKNLEARVQDRSDRLDQALNASQMGMWEWYVDSGELVWSDQLKQIFGLSPKAEITYEKYIGLLHPDDRKNSQTVIEDAMKTGKAYRFEHRAIWPDGSVHWLLGQGQAIYEKGKPVKMVGTTMNIDQRKEFEMQLAESEKRFRHLADRTPVLIWMSDSNMGWNYVNKYWINFTGRPLTKEMGKGWTAGIHTEDRHNVVRQMNAALKDRRGFSVEFRMRRRDGHYRWMFANGVPRFSIDHEFLGYIGSCLDIENVKRAIESRQELEAKTEALTAERKQLMVINSKKDEFISLASHQLRTPATGVKQFLGMMLEGYVGEFPKEQRDMIKMAYDSNERQIQVIDDLLKVAKVDDNRLRINRKEYSLNKLIKTIIRELESSFIERQQQIIFKEPPRDVKAPLDKHYMRMVLENIIENAGKYSPEGKVINIEIKKTGNRAVIGITDHGVGIANKDHKKLFQKFSRINNPLSAKVGGTGLGLYWAKKVIDLHGGTIKVRSKIHQGTTFQVILPLDV